MDFLILIPIALGVIGFWLFWNEIGQFALDIRKSVHREVLDYKIVCEGEEFAPYVKLGSNWYRICGAHNKVVNPAMLAEGLYFKCDTYEKAFDAIEIHKNKRRVARMEDTVIYNTSHES